jgi:hypothetical protein
VEAELEIPSWHLQVIRERLEDYKNNPDQALDFENAMDEIEKELV